MKFPVSVLPSITIVGNAVSFIVMLFFIGLILIVNQINSGIYLLQLPYYLVSLFVFIFAISIFNSTLATIVRDYQILLQSMVRMLFFLNSNFFWVPSRLPEQFQVMLKLNPLYYLIDGFRNTFF